MKYFFVIASLFLLNLSANSADDYKVGDTLYVWSKQGLKLRDGPGISGGVTSTVEFAERVTVVGLTDLKFNLLLFSPITMGYVWANAEPVVLYGHWTLVINEDGETGYVYDQYLLQFPPFQANNLNLHGYGLSLPIDRIDTTYVDTTQKYDGLLLTIVIQYTQGITCTMGVGSKSSGASYFFEGFTIEEALVLIRSSLGQFEHFRVYRNWPDSILATDKALCELEVSVVKDGVRINVSCSYC
jgi:hypothetical protein